MLRILQKIWHAENRLHLISSVLSVSILLTLVIMNQDVTQDDTISGGYSSLIPSSPNGLDTQQVWSSLKQLVTSALHHQNITFNGTLRGVLSLRQFRVPVNFSDRFQCDFYRLSRESLEVPINSTTKTAWRHTNEKVKLTAPPRGRWCTYPPDGYNIYLGELQARQPRRQLFHTIDAIHSILESKPNLDAERGKLREVLFTKLSLPVNFNIKMNATPTNLIPPIPTDPFSEEIDLDAPSPATYKLVDPIMSIGKPPNVSISGAVTTGEMLWDGLHALNEMQNNSWIDNQTLAVLLSLANVDPYDYKVTTVTIIFENLQMYGSSSDTIPLLWTTSFTSNVIDLQARYSILSLSIAFLIVHAIVALIELDISVATLVLDKKGPLKVIWRALSLTTALNVAIFVIHIIYLIENSAIDPLKQSQVEFIIMLLENNFEGEVPEHIHNVGSGVEYPLYKRLRLEFADIVSLRKLCTNLLTTDLVLYIIKFVTYKKYCGTILPTVLRGVQKSAPLVFLTMASLLGPILLVTYLTSHKTDDSLVTETFQTISSVLGVWHYGYETTQPSLAGYLTTIFLLTVVVITSLIIIHTRTDRCEITEILSPEPDQYEDYEFPSDEEESSQTSSSYSSTSYSNQGDTNQYPFDGQRLSSEGYEMEDMRYRLLL